MKKIPKNIKLILSETDTIFLLDINSNIVTKDSIEGKAIEEDNEKYNTILSNAQRIRKVVSIGIQTRPMLKKTRSTTPHRFEFSNSATFASNWEMHDTYKAILKDDTHSYFHENDISDEEEENNEDILVQKCTQTELLRNLETNKRYFDAVLVIERLLANNSYNEEQKTFKNLTENHFQTQNYDYQLKLLWTFSNENTKNRCVTALSFNPLNDEILAVGYGKYYFIDRKSTGIVMIWNIKNPRQPERQYHFLHSVTALQFCERNPNFLCVGFYNGCVKILDISKREMVILGESTSPYLEPAWDILWLSHDTINYFLVCYGDGRVCKYRFFESDYHLENVTIMKTNKTEGKLKGLKRLGIFEGNEIASSRFASAMRLCLSSSNTYFVATNEGCIRNCSINFCTQHLNMFKAHEGTIHTIKYSPFVKKVFATTGDDFQTCFWIEGFNEPLITSRFSMEPVLDLDWSPSHSTIIVSLQGLDIFLWDLQRKIHLPQSKFESPTNSRNTLCRFTKCGRCLLIGDVDGNVHIFSVNGFPPPAFFQDNLFVQSIKKLLATNSDLLKKVEKIK